MFIHKRNRQLLNRLTLFDVPLRDNNLYQGGVNRISIHLCIVQYTAYRRNGKLAESPSCSHEQAHECTVVLDNSPKPILQRSAARSNLHYHKHHNACSQPLLSTTSQLVCNCVDYSRDSMHQNQATEHVTVSIKNRLYTERQKKNAVRQVYNTESTL